MYHSSTPEVGYRPFLVLGRQRSGPSLERLSRKSESFRRTTAPGPTVGLTLEYSMGLGLGGRFGEEFRTECHDVLLFAKPQ